MKKEVFFTFERGTKRTFRFKETNANGEFVDLAVSDIGTLYVKQSVFNGKQPDMIKVTIETAE